jgi:hypothetical protein
MSKLLDNIHRMSNVEHNNLAKNLFLDDELQCWIARKGHIQARYYLAENAAICDMARDILLSGRSVAAKCSLVAMGTVKDQEVIRDTYYAAVRSNIDPYKVTSSFVRNHWFYHRKTIEGTNTPGDVLEHIYKNNAHRTYMFDGLSIDIANHHNCTLKLAIIMSTDSNSRIAIAGKKALVRISSKASID